MNSNFRSAAQAKVEHIHAMGSELGGLYDALWQEVASLHSKWSEYVILFGTKPSRIDLLNQAAPSFFRLIQDALWEDAVLHIARLIDSPMSVGKPNLSVRRIPQLIEDVGLGEKVKTLVDVCLKESEFSRDWRNRHLAHRDLGRAISDNADPLMEGSRAQAKLALQSLACVLNALAEFYLDTSLSFDPGYEPGGAEALLYVLDDGLKYEKARTERIEAGTYHQEDFLPRDL
jgi:hypothetical protein